MSGLVSLLGLVCGLLLAAPPAWCCYNPLRQAPAPTEPDKTCGCCAKKEAPPPAPICPASPAPCPWYDHNTVAPTGPEKFGASPALFVSLSLAVLDIPCAGPSALVAAFLPVLSRPLHLLQCLWLC